jgi:nucleotide sugar dehydrogenase
MEIGVIGIGKLGLSFALLLEKAKFNVFGSDVSQEYCDMINNKTLISFEPGINELLKNSENLTVSCDNLKVIEKSEIIFTFVQTPSNEDGGYNHSNIESIINDFNILYKNGVNLTDKIFVIGCTTMPNYVDTVYNRLKNYGVHVCYNPEFIAQGEIIKGLELSDMVLIGSSSVYATNKLKDIYEKIMLITPKFNVMSNTAAEITKISINCFLTTKISFANMIGEICLKSNIGEEISLILNAIGDDSRVGNKYLKFGYGFGGPCLPRDNRALGKHMENIKLKINLPYEVDKFNYNHNNFLYNRLIEQNTDINTPFIFNTVSYKKGIDIITESQQLKLAETLLNNGYRVIIVDIPRVLNMIEKDLKSKYGEKVTLSSENNHTGYNINL